MNPSEIKNLPTWIAVLLILIAIALPAWLNYLASQSAVNREYVGVAIEILRDSNSNTELKNWAIDVVDEKSPVPLTLEIRTGFLDGTISFPTSTLFMDNSGAFNLDNFFKLNTPKE